MSGKRRTERARRTVADALGNIADRQVLAPQQILCDGHAPGEQVFHRRQADCASERAKKAERDTAAVRASWPTVHARVS